MCCCCLTLGKANLLSHIPLASPITLPMLVSYRIASLTHWVGKKLDKEVSLRSENVQSSNKSWVPRRGWFSWGYWAREGRSWVRERIGIGTCAEGRSGITHVTAEFPSPTRLIERPEWRGVEKHPGVPAPKTYSSNLIERGRFFFCDKIKKNLKTRSAWIIKVGL